MNTSDNVKKIMCASSVYVSIITKFNQNSFKNKEEDKSKNYIKIIKNKENYNLG